MATEVVIFIIATLGCNLLIGYVGLMSFGQAIFFGVGAYACSLTLLHSHVGIGAGLLAAIAASAIVALFVGFLSTQKRGIYFVMLTFAFSQMFYFIAYAMAGLTGGDNGLLDIPRPPLVLFHVTLLSLTPPLEMYGLAAVVFVALFVFLQRVITSPFGSTLQAIRENEQRAIAVGYNTRNFKVIAFVLSGVVTGIAGALYALFLQFAPLGNIDVSMSERIIVMSILGGTGSLFGSVLGGTFYVVAGNMLSAIWPRWLLLLGLILMVVGCYLQGGLLGAAERLARRIGRRGPRAMTPAASNKPVGRP